MRQCIKRQREQREQRERERAAVEKAKVDKAKPKLSERAQFMQSMSDEEEQEVSEVWVEI